MTLDTAKAAVDFLHNNLKRKREITKKKITITKVMTICFILFVIATS